MMIPKNAPIVERTDMKRIECDHCGSVVVIAERAETVTKGETPVEHLERTGHSHVREPQMTGCPNCENIWMYGGDADRATCPNCHSKAEAGAVPRSD